MFLQKIKLENLLSFKEAELELRPLNVLIGPNASGKSNLIRAIGLLRSVPKNLAGEIASGGGTRAWINQRTKATASIQVEGKIPAPAASFEYQFSFSAAGDGFNVFDDKLNVVTGQGPHRKHSMGGLVPVTLADLANASPNDRISKRLGVRTTAVVVVSAHLDGIRLYRGFHVGPDSTARRGITASALGESLSEDGANLALVLSNLALLGVLPKVEANLKKLHEPFEEIRINPRGGIAQVYVKETAMEAPLAAVSLSDGTLRLLCLLAVLLGSA
jgi:predicted ATPase